MRRHNLLTRATVPLGERPSLVFGTSKPQFDNDQRLPYDCVGRFFVQMHNIMADSLQPPDELRVELRRYPNRRYYDCTRSQHMTLEDIYRLVREGYSVTVVDSKTGGRHHGPLVDAIDFGPRSAQAGRVPVELLHQIIRSNESLLRDFVEKYFNRALTAFLKSQREFDRYLGQTLGLYSAPLVGGGWAEMMMGPFMRAFTTDNGDKASTEGHPSTESPPPAEAELRQTVNDLKQQVATLRKELEKR